MIRYIEIIIGLLLLATSFMIKTNHKDGCVDNIQSVCARINEPLSDADFPRVRCEYNAVVKLIKINVKILELGELNTYDGISDDNINNLTKHIISKFTSIVVRQKDFPTKYFITRLSKVSIAYAKQLAEKFIRIDTFNYSLVAPGINQDTIKEIYTIDDIWPHPQFNDIVNIIVAQTNNIFPGIIMRNKFILIINRWNATILDIRSTDYDEWSLYNDESTN